MKRRSIIAALGLGALLAGLVGASSPALAAPATAPSAPTGLSANPGDTTVMLSWTAPTNNGGSALTGYNLYQGTSAGGENYGTAVNASLITTTAYTVTGLMNATKYYFTVKAVNSRRVLDAVQRGLGHSWRRPCPVHPAASSPPGPIPRQVSPGTRRRTREAPTSPSTRSLLRTRPPRQEAARPARGARDRSLAR